VQLSKKEPIMKKSIKPLLLVISLVLAFVYIGFNVGAQSDVESETFPIGENLTESNNINEVVVGGPGFIMFHATEFIPFSQTFGYAFTNSTGALWNPDPSNNAYIAPMNLPHGATITKLVVYYFDNSAVDFTTSILRTNMDTNINTLLASASSEGVINAPRVAEDSVVDLPVVDNQSFSYVLRVILPGSQGETLTLRGVRVDYSYPVSLPLINK